MEERWKTTLTEEERQALIEENRRLRMELGLPLEPVRSGDTRSLEEIFAGLSHCTDLDEDPLMATTLRPNEKEKHSD